MKDKLWKTWSKHVRKGERFFRLRRFLWRLRYCFFPFRKTKYIDHKELNSFTEYVDEFPYKFRIKNHEKKPKQEKAGKRENPKKPDK